MPRSTRGIGTASSRRRKGETEALVRDYLASHPGIEDRELAEAGRREGFASSSVKRWRKRLTDKGVVQRAGRRNFLGEIGDPDLAVAGEVTRTLAVLRSRKLGTEAKREALRQLCRGTTLAPPKCDEVVDLLGLGRTLPGGLQLELLPIVQRTLREALSANGDREYAVRVWDAARWLLDRHLERRADIGTAAWNALYPVADSAGFLADDELMDYGTRAISVELAGGLAHPSPARAFLQRLGREDRLRGRIRVQVLSRIRGPRNSRRNERLRRILSDLDLKSPPAALAAAAPGRTAHSPSPSSALPPNEPPHAKDRPDADR